MKNECVEKDLDNFHQLESEVLVFRDKIEDFFLNLDFATRQIKNLLDNLHNFYKIYFYSDFLRELYQHYTSNINFLSQVKLDNSDIIMFSNEFNILVNLVKSLNQKKALVRHQGLNSKFISK